MLELFQKLSAINQFILIYFQFSKGISDVRTLTEISVTFLSDQKAIIGVKSALSSLFFHV